jgi:hypothetical protein
MFLWRDRPLRLASAGLTPGASNIVAPSGLAHFAKFVQPTVTEIGMRLLQQAVGRLRKTVSSRKMLIGRFG